MNLENAYLIFLRYVGVRKQKYFNLQETKCMGLSLLPVCSLVQPSLDNQSAVWLVFCGAMYIKKPFARFSVESNISRLESPGLYSEPSTGLRRRCMLGTSILGKGSSRTGSSRPASATQDSVSKTINKQMNDKQILCLCDSHTWFYRSFTLESPGPHNPETVHDPRLTQVYLLLTLFTWQPRFYGLAPALFLALTYQSSPCSMLFLYLCRV